MRTASRVVGLLAGLVVAIIGARSIIQRFNSERVVSVGEYELTIANRQNTGHQRVERITFANRGQLLAALCPRYRRLVLYRVADELILLRDVELAGRPVAIAAADDRLLVLERPRGDLRHVEFGFIQAYDFNGDPIGARIPIGWDPDDAAWDQTRKIAYVITSGRAEGDPNKPAPELVSVDYSNRDAPRVVARLPFEITGDNPVRLIQANGGMVAVSLQGTNSVAIVDVSESDRPRIARRIGFDGATGGKSGVMPGSLSVSPASVLLIADVRSGAVWTFDATSDRAPRRFADGVSEVANLDEHAAVFLRPAASEIVIESLGGRGAIPILGASRLRSVDLCALAVAEPDRKALAVADRSGGVRLLHVRRRDSIESGVAHDPPGTVALVKRR